MTAFVLKRTLRSKSLPTLWLFKRRAMRRESNAVAKTSGHDEVYRWPTSVITQIVVSSGCDPRKYTDRRLSAMLRGNTQYPELRRTSEEDVWNLRTLLHNYGSSLINRIVYGKKSQDWTSQHEIDSILGSVDRELRTVLLDRWELCENEINKIVVAKLYSSTEFPPHVVATILRYLQEAREIPSKIDFPDVNAIFEYLNDFNHNNYRFWVKRFKWPEGRKILAELREDLKNAKASEDPGTEGSSVDTEPARSPSPGSFENDLKNSRASEDLWTDCSSLDTLRAEKVRSPSLRSCEELEETPHQPAELV